MAMKKEYKSRIDKPANHTTSKGVSYVTTFDVVRSAAGRDLIDRHAAMAESLGLERSAGSPNRGNGNKTPEK